MTPHIKLFISLTDRGIEEVCGKPRFIEYTMHVKNFLPKVLILSILLKNFFKSETDFNY